MENTKETLRKNNFALSVWMEHSVKIQFLFWKYTMDGLLDSWDFMVPELLPYNSIFTFDFE